MKDYIALLAKRVSQLTAELRYCEPQPKYPIVIKIDDDMHITIIGNRHDDYPTKAEMESIYDEVTR